MKTSPRGPTDSRDPLRSRRLIAICGGLLFRLGVVMPTVKDVVLEEGQWPDGGDVSVSFSISGDTLWVEFTNELDTDDFVFVPWVALEELATLAKLAPTVFCAQD